MEGDTRRRLIWVRGEKGTGTISALLGLGGKSMVGREDEADRHRGWFVVDGTE